MLNDELLSSNESIIFRPTTTTHPLEEPLEDQRLCSLALLPMLWLVVACYICTAILSKLIYLALPSILLRDGQKGQLIVRQPSVTVRICLLHIDK